MKSIAFRNLNDTQRFCVQELCAELGLSLCEDAPHKVRIQQGNSLSLSEQNGEILVTYGTEPELYRALSYLPRFLEDKTPVCNQSHYDMLCYMADMSRNAVYNIPTAKKMIRYLALMGYNSLMLYTEDTYEIPELPYFGHMRGRFSKEDLKELDDYAFGFGIEVIPCIQTLAHMATALRWPDFEGYIDIDDILLVGDERTYRFVDLALSVCAECFRSRRINIGMDEAHNIGRGVYRDRNGARQPADIMREHLEQVIALCEKHGFHPMIWSDMFFRMAFGGTYRVREGEIPPEIIASVPKNLTLIYWDYYSLDKPRVEHMIDCHLKFDNPIAFAGGAWKWYGFGAHNKYSLKSTELQLDVCAEKGIRDVIVTAWGDDGNEASQFSVLASMLYFAERKYLDSASITEGHMEARAGDCFGIGFEELLRFDLPDSIPGCGLAYKSNRPQNPSRYLFYNDVLEGLMDYHVEPETAPAAFAENAQKLMEMADHPTFGYAYETLGRLCLVLAQKATLGIELRAAYKKKDLALLSALADRIDRVKALTEDFLTALRRQWYRENKTFGLSCHEQRIGGLMARLDSSSARVRAYVAGEIPAIEELEQPVLPFKTPAPDAASAYIAQVWWNETVAAGRL